MIPFIVRNQRHGDNAGDHGGVDPKKEVVVSEKRYYQKHAYKY